MHHDDTKRSVRKNNRDKTRSKEKDTTNHKVLAARPVTRPVMGIGSVLRQQAATGIRQNKEGHIQQAGRTCVACDGPISNQRLKARPDATRCVTCQGKVDQRYVAGDYGGRSLEDIDATDFAIVHKPYQPIPEVMNIRIMHPRKVTTE